MALASRGLRDFGGGTEGIDDAVERAVVRAQARKVLLKSIAATASVMVGMALLWSSLA